MSSALLKAWNFTRIPLVRYSAKSKRINKAEVQLLKDFPNVGVKGQIVKVSHSMMRNRLHRHNGATYIVPGQGPKIPVVVPSKKQAAPEVVKIVQPKPENPVTPKTKAKPEVNIKGLLLDLPKATGEESAAAKPKVKASSGFSLFKLSINLGDLRFKSTTPITNKDIISQITQQTDITVPSSDIKITTLDDAVIEQIKEAGDYKLTISQGTEKVEKSIFVEA